MLDFGFSTEQEIRAELAARLQASRLSQGLTQAELAERAGISVSTVKLWEKTGSCTLENFVRIVMGLGQADELQSLFTVHVRSIADMERAAKVQRLRAPRTLRS